MKHYIIESIQDFRELQKYVLDNVFPIIVLDLETDTVSEVEANTYGIGIAFHEDEAFYIPTRTKAGDLWFDDTTYTEIIDWVSTCCKNKKLIGHNIIYDVLVWRYSYNIDLAPFIYSDTILLKHMIDEERPFGLKEVAVKYLGAWADQAQKDMYDSIVANGGSITKTNLQMFKADTEILGRYCAWDCMLTFKLYNLFQPRLESEGLSKLFYEEETMPLYREVTIPMKYCGVTVDMPHFNQIKIDIQAKLIELEDNLYSSIKDLVIDFEQELLDDLFPIKKSGSYPKMVAKLVGLEMPSLAKKAIQNINPTSIQQSNFKDWLLNDAYDLLVPKSVVQQALYFEKFPDKRYVFNFKSKDHLKALFIEALGETALSKTDGGQPKMDAEFLDSMVKRHSWVSLLLDINTLNKIEGTYVDGLLERTVNGKLHTSFLQFGTTSGRFSSTNPNLQNIPAPQDTHSEVDKFVNAIRKGLVARPGYKLIGADYSSLEPHIAAYVSGDKDLIDIFVTGKDFYSAIAIKQFNLTHLSAYKDDVNYLGTLDKATRNKTKTYSLAAFYGATAPRISQVLNSSKEEAQELLDGYLSAFPGIKTLIETAHNNANRKGEVRTIFGRVRHLTEARMLYKSYGDRLKDFMWANKMGLLDERKKYRNLINNAVNFQIQGAAGHVLNRAMIKVARELTKSKIDGRIIMTIHDELLVEVKEDQIEQASKIIKQSMETAVDLSPIKLKATPIVGHSYGDCK